MVTVTLSWIFLPVVGLLVAVAVILAWRLGFLRGRYILKHRELTPRQSGIMDLVCAGKTNKAIASKIGVCEQTVKNHMSEIYGRLNVSNRAEAAVKYRQGRQPS